MENFKEIAEKCLAGELSGIFIFNTGMKLHSQYLKKSGSENYFYLRGFFIDKKGHLITKGVEAGEIINFIPDNMQKKIEIDIPEGKVPVMKQTENEVVITWKKKELTYYDISNHIWEQGTQIGVLTSTVVNDNTNKFSKKVEVLRKLTNIRNYFGGDKPTNQWTLTIDSALNIYPVLRHYRETNRVYFATQEHAEQAIKMLGDELKYLFEPW